MKENLNYSRGNTLGWCYVVNGKNLGTAGAGLSGCDSPYGRNYTYSIAIDGNKPQGLCPRGWHIPSVDEWTTLGAGTSASITGTRRMSSAFYVYSGNYDYSGYEGRAAGWYDRDKNGFYLTNDNENRFVLMGTSNGNNYFYSRSDAMDPEYYSIRCVADDGVFSVSSSSAATSSGSSSSSTTTSSSSGTTPSSPSGQSDEAIYCSGATKIISFNGSNASASATTTDAVCFKITGNISGWSASNANERICWVNNGEKVNSIGTNISNQPLASAINGYVYINCSKGSEPYFNISIW